MLQLIGISFHQRDLQLDMRLKANIAQLKFMLAKEDTALQKLFNPYLSKGDRRFSGKCQQIGNNLGTPLGFTFHKIEILTEFFPLVFSQGTTPQDSNHEPDIIKNPCKRIVNFMDYACRQSSQGHHFILVEYPGLIRNLPFQPSDFLKIPEKTYQPGFLIVLKQNGS